MRTRGRIDASQRAIVQALRQAGASVVSTAPIGDGFPDLVIGHVGRWWLAEVKDGAKAPSARTLTPAQVAFRATWRGPDPVTLTSVDEALALLRTPATVCHQPGERALTVLPCVHPPLAPERPMPSAPLAYCATPGCPQRVPSGHCVQHRRTRATQWASREHRFYTWPWRRYSHRRLQRLPLCGMREDEQRYPDHSRCTREGRLEVATCTDHIVPHHGDEALFWDPQNHQSLCTTCHNTKTAHEDGAFGA